MELIGLGGNIAFYFSQNWGKVSLKAFFTGGLVLNGIDCSVYKQACKVEVWAPRESNVPDFHRVMLKTKFHIFVFI